MTLGDQPAFPLSLSSDPQTGHYTYCESHPGMSYRMWLVGQIAGWTYAEMMKIDLNKNPGINLEGSVARMTIEVADAIIKRLEANE